MTVAAAYDRLNRLFGTPTVIQAGRYGRTAQLVSHAVPFLEEAETHMRPCAAVLVVGCGDGHETEWFASRGYEVTGIDVYDRAIQRTEARIAQYPNAMCRLVGKSALPFESEAFDLIFMHNVCEHIAEIEACFTEYRRVLKRGGVIVNSFAPLFYSPYGAHLQDALKMPWGHLLFGRRAVLELRNRYYPGHKTADTWNDMGLNRITERRYRRVVDRLGFDHLRYDIHTSLSVPLVQHIPGIRNLFIAGVTDILVKR